MITLLALILLTRIPVAPLVACTTTEPTAAVIFALNVNCTVEKISAEISPFKKSTAGISSTKLNLLLKPLDLDELKLRTAGNKSEFISPELFSCITAPGTALVETDLSIKFPKRFDKKLLIANCVINRLSLAPPTSLSPNPISLLINVITILPIANLSASS